LDVSQIKAGTIRKNVKSVNINRVLQEVLDLQEISAEMKQVELVFKRMDDPFIDVDADRL
jgi:signal transduction histidine kinase